MLVKLILIYIKEAQHSNYNRLKNQEPNIKKKVWGWISNYLKVHSNVHIPSIKLEMTIISFEEKKQGSKNLN